MAQKDSSHLDALYFRGPNSYNNAAIQRQRSVGAAMQGNNIFQLDQPFMNISRQGGKKMIQMHDDQPQASHLLTGGYGVDPASALENNFKPYARR